MISKNIIRTAIASHQPSRVIGKSIRNIFFPDKKKINRMITIEISSICNARCIFCNYRFGYRKKKTMDTEDFKKIAESCIQLGYDDLSFTSMGGEVFTHKNAVEIIKIAKNKGFNGISCFTNGISIHKYDVEGLLRSGINHIFISFPGFSEDLYEEIFQVRKFSDFKESIMILLKTHRKINSRVKIEFLPRTYLTEEEIFKSEFYTSFVSKYMSDLVYFDEPLYFYDSWGGEIDSSQLIMGMKVDMNPLKSLYPFKKTYLCHFMLRFAVFANKDVRLCNCRYDSTIETSKDTLYIANLGNYSSLEELMLRNRAKIDKIRTDFINGNMPELCRKCPLYLPVDFKIYSDYVKNENTINHLS